MAHGWLEGVNLESMFDSSSHWQYNNANWSFRPARVLDAKMTTMIILVLMSMTITRMRRMQYSTNVQGSKS